MQEDSRQQARLAGGLGNLPLIALVSGPTRPDDTDSMYEVHSFQPRLAAISSRGRVEVTYGRMSRETIAEAIKQVVDDALRQRALR